MVQLIYHAPQASLAVSASPGLIRQFEPFRELPDDQIIILSSKSNVEHAGAKFCLFERDACDDWVICLIEGTIELVAMDGASKLIEGGSEQARRPLAQLKPRKYTAIAKSPIKYLRIDTSTLADLNDIVADSHYGIEEFGSDDEELNSDVLWRQHSDLLNGKLSLPSLPAVAMKVCQLIDRDDANVGNLARTINTDPAIAAKLIRAANSPLYRGQAPTDSCDKAVVRLGLKTTRQLVSSFAMSELFSTDSPLLSKRMGVLWRHSTEVASICYVLAVKTKTLEPEQALLAGLLHDIGSLPLLSYSHNTSELADDPVALEAFLEMHRSRVGTSILEKWNFPNSLVVAAQSADDWLRDSMAEADYGDLVIIAQLHSFIGTPHMPKIPPMDELPAFRKLAGNGLTPKLSVDIIHEAKHEIERVRALLSS
ncbi:MAG: HD-like signal output (HDOD) protein [Gammaproteobacteria bacterium]|jgi:HD-like signal output (HDOD) protein